MRQVALGIALSILSSTAAAQQPYGGGHQEHQKVPSSEPYGAPLGGGHVEHHSWYERLKTPQGYSCCNNADCRPVRSILLPDGGYQVFIRGRWLPVPPERVLPGWMNWQPLYSHVCEQDGYIRCFLPGSSGG